MIYVQHLLGVGHLKRMTLLADSLANAGATVMLVSGGMPAPHISASEAVSFQQLPPLKAIDETFSGLADETGAPAPESLKENRTAELLHLLEDFAPDTLVVELFPLGRRQMRFELLPLLEAARNVTRAIVCSVRDIVNRRPRREAESLDWLNRYFDLLMVHGDETMTPISDSVPGIGHFGGRVVHTGYLAEPWSRQGERDAEVLVTAGGGAAGVPLFRAAAEATGLTEATLRWRIRHSPTAGALWIEELREIAAPGTIIEPVAGDFRERLAQCQVSVSQFGYNTAMDILTTATAAVIVPFEGGKETEQIRRAEAFRSASLSVVREADLNGRSLAAAIDEIAAAPADFPQQMNMDGLHCATSLLLSD